MNFKNLFGNLDFPLYIYNHMKKADNFDLKKFIIENRVNESPLDKNLLKNISKTLIKRNPNIDKMKIISTVKSWLDKDKNLMVATNAMGNNYERDVLKSIEDRLTKTPMGSQILKRFDQ